MEVIPYCNHPFIDLFPSSSTTVPVVFPCSLSVPIDSLLSCLSVIYRIPRCVLIVIGDELLLLMNGFIRNITNYVQ